LAIQEDEARRRFRLEFSAAVVRISVKARPRNENETLPARTRINMRHCVDGSRTGSEVGHRRPAQFRQRLRKSNRCTRSTCR